MNPVELLPKMIEIVKRVGRDRLYGEVNEFWHAFGEVMFDKKDEKEI